MNWDDLDEEELLSRFLQLEERIDKLEEKLIQKNEQIDEQAELIEKQDKLIEQQSERSKNSKHSFESTKIRTHRPVSDGRGPIVIQQTSG